MSFARRRCAKATRTSPTGQRSQEFVSQMLNVWYIHLHEWLIFMVNVGKYTIRGSYAGVCSFSFHRRFTAFSIDQHHQTLHYLLEDSKNLR